MTTFADIPEQAEAKRLLEAALADGPAHAYLFHGPAGVGKRPAARALAGALLGDPRRVDGRTHPDLHVTEALGAMIRIDEIRALITTCTSARSRPTGACTSSSTPTG